MTGNGGTGFGTSPALSENGDVLMVGDAGAGAAPGAVYVYRRSGARWVSQAILHQPNSSSRQNGFGIDIAISSSGTSALIVGNSFHHAYLFAKAAGRWSLRASFGIPHQQIGAATLSGNGQRVVIPYGLSASPTADVYMSTAGRWRKEAHLVGQRQKIIVLAQTIPAVSFDGSTVALGGPVFAFRSTPRGPGSVDVFGQP